MRMQRRSLLTPMTHSPNAPTPWRKSSYSTSNGKCVGVAVLAHNFIGVRDRKDTDGTDPLVHDGRMACISR